MQRHLGFALFVLVAIAAIWIAWPDGTTETSTPPAAPGADTGRWAGENPGRVDGDPPATALHRDSMTLRGDVAVMHDAPSTAALVEVGEPAPLFELTSLDGGRFRLRDEQGKVILVNFWATWCEPCHEEMADLQMLYEATPRTDVEIVGVSLDEGERTVVEAFHAAYPVDFALLLDGLPVARSYGAHYAVPTTFIIDRSGNVAHRFVGAVAFEDVHPLLESML